jgi:hypothetical protein
MMLEYLKKEKFKHITISSEKLTDHFKTIGLSMSQHGMNKNMICPTTPKSILSIVFKDEVAYIDTYQEFLNKIKEYDHELSKR